MKWIALYVLVVAWAGLITMWPESIDDATFREESRQNASREDLYKSSLTKANFGLLGVRFYETNEGKKRWVINSKFAELHRKENYAYLQDVDSQFFAAKTGNIVTTKSDYGRSWTDKHLVELEGRVNIRSKRGYLFNMERLNYNGSVHEFTSEDVVHMRGPLPEHPLMLLRGTGLTADIDKEHFLLRRNVSAQKKLKSNEWLKITSRAGEFFTDENRAIFIGKVHSAFPQMTIDSDIFELSVSQEKESALARGNVVLKSRDRTGYAESATLELGGNRIVLEGRARIDQKDNQIRGRRILLYTDDDKVEVEEAEGKVSQMILSATNLSKSFKGKKAVVDVSLQIQNGRVLGLLGPNGAGKTTTFYMIVGLVRPDSGQVQLDGNNLAHRPIYERARMGLGYLPQDASVFRKLSVEENLFLVLDNLKISRKEKRARAERALQDLGISHLAKNRALTLSGGERRRLEIARALILEPKFLLLDEPYAGIDPLAVQEIQNIIRSLKERGIGIIITDHNVRETLSTCDEAYLIKDGNIWMHGSPKEIVENESARKFYLGESFRL